MTVSAQVGGVGRYARLLRTEHVAGILGWSVVARLPLGMTPLALVLVVRSEGSAYAAAGLVAAAYSVGLSVGAPVAGRQIDRRGRRHVLAPRAVAYGCLLGGVGALAVTGAPPAALVAAAAAAGAALPPVGASVRTLLPAIAPIDLRTTAFALEASLQEVFFVGGPLLVAVLATWSPVAALAGAAAAGGAGTLALVRRPPVRQPPAVRHERARGGALSRPGVRTLVALAVCLGLAFGSLEVSLPAFAEHHGHRSLAGLALACFSAGSLLGGLLVGLRHVANERRQLALCTVVMPAALALPLLARSIPAVCVLLLAAGMPIAPLVTAVYGLVDRVAPAGTHAEAFAWIGTAITTGLAAGTGAGGWLVDDRGVRTAMALGVLAAVAGAVVALARRATLVGEPA